MTELCTKCGDGLKTDGAGFKRTFSGAKFASASWFGRLCFADI